MPTTSPRLKTLTNSSDNMTFWDHLDALRGVIFRVAAVVIGISIALFFVMRWIFYHIIMWPCRADFPLYSMLNFMHGDGDFLPDMTNNDFSVNVININLGTQLITHLSASLWLALALSFPIIIYLIWSFVRPALYEHERRGARKAFFFGNVMFYLGIAVGYFIVFPMALRFLSQYQLSADIQNSLTLDSYMDNFYSIIVSMGVVFEMPLLAWMLGNMGLLHRSFFKKYRRHAIVALAALAAFITPTSDAFTLFIVFIPLYALWEFSARIVPRS